VAEEEGSGGAYRPDEGLKCISARVKPPLKEVRSSARFPSTCSRRTLAHVHRLVEREYLCPTSRCRSRPIQAEKSTAFWKRDTDCSDL